MEFSTLGFSSNTSQTTPAAEGGGSGGCAAGESKYRGVWKRRWGKYVSEIRLPKSRERIWLGSHDTAEKAARAFDAALFCLRGPAAKFNFPDDPPEIPGGEGFSPPEIQAAAQSYADSCGGGPQVENGEENGLRARAGPEEMVDRAFWEMVDMNGGHNGDFGLFSEPGEMYMEDPHYDVARLFEDDVEFYDHGGLWNF